MEKLEEEILRLAVERGLITPEELDPSGPSVPIGSVLLKMADLLKK